MSNKHNLVLYIDKDLVEKTRNLGFNLSKTFENHLKQLLTQFSTVNSMNSTENNTIQNVWWAGPDSNRRPSARQAPSIPTEESLAKFREFLKVDLRRSDKTAYEHTYYVKKFLNELTKPVESATGEDVREYLKHLKISSAQYKNILRAHSDSSQNILPRISCARYGLTQGSSKTLVVIAVDMWTESAEVGFSGNV